MDPVDIENRGISFLVHVNPVLLRWGFFFMDKMKNIIPHIRNKNQIEKIVETEEQS
jgi:hypothetical protein